MLHEVYSQGVSEANTCKYGAQLAVILSMKHIVLETECLEEKRQSAHRDYENYSTDRGLYLQWQIMSKSIMVVCKSRQSNHKVTGWQHLRSSLRCSVLYCVNDIYLASDLENNMDYHYFWTSMDHKPLHSAPFPLYSYSSFFPSLD